MSFHRVRLPISTRHAFALAFDLAFRRDIGHSLLVPLLLRSPWIVALAVLPPPASSSDPTRVTILTAVALVGDFLVGALIGGMLRFRARSVFNTPLDVHPAPASDCYAHGFSRVPWLVVTEIVRNMAIVFATIFLVLPGVFLGFRLSFATEAVVLHERTIEGAFRRSFRLTEGRLERWLEMIVVSVVLVFAAIVLATLTLLALGVSPNVWIDIAYVFTTALLPVIQYAWTFFYLRLVETDISAPIEVGPLYAGAVLAAGAAVHGPDPVAAASPSVIAASPRGTAPLVSPNDTVDDRSPASEPGSVPGLPHVPPSSGSRA